MSRIAEADGGSNATPALSTSGVAKRFEETTVLSDLTFAVGAGEAAALLGPNGAGKTTLLRCLAGLLRPSEGRISVFGHDLYRNELAAKRELTYVPDTPHFYPELTILEHLKLVALAHGAAADWAKRARELLTAYGLPRADSLPHELSRGMAQKLAICCALVRPWGLMLLDEPTANLDRQAFENLKSTLERSKREGRAFILSTHQLALAAELCDRYLVLAGGRLIFSGSAAEMISSVGLPSDAPVAAAYDRLIDQGAAK